MADVLIVKEQPDGSLTAHRDKSFNDDAVLNPPKANEIRLAGDYSPPVAWKYMKRNGSTVEEMTQPEKDVVDAAEAQAESDRKDALASDLGEILTAFMLIMLDEINILRGEAGLAPRTIQQLKNALRSKL